MFKKLKDKKGFTLVELIVVLVILAILAALLVPALTGYIDRANEEKVVAEARMALMAAQTQALSSTQRLRRALRLYLIRRQILRAIRTVKLRLQNSISWTMLSLLLQT